jgi:hypothetical protein
MKKLFPLVVAVACGLLFFVSCNKGDDNPYADWKCTCFVTQVDSLRTPTDTIPIFTYDTVYLQANDMDRVSAESFCKQAQVGYTDTLGSVGACKLK